MNDILVGILNGINSVIHNYGWSMIVFTLLIKLLILPLDYKSRKSMRRMTNLQPEMMKLQKKYANDKEKLNQKTAELYRREGISPMSGCLPMAEQTIELLTTGAQANESWLWIKNIWMPDSPFHSVMADTANLRMIPADIWAKTFAALSADASKVNALAAFGIDASTISGETVFAALQTLPQYVEETKLWATMPHVNLIIANLSIYANNNGWFILPVLAAVTQYLMTLSQPQAAATDPNNPQASTGKFMKYFFPLFSLWICSSQNAMFSLYWVVSNVFAWGQSVMMNKIFENKEKKEQQSIGEESLK